VQVEQGYGCADMLDNVAGWTSSMFWDCPYQPDDGRNGLQRSRVRVVRGGDQSQ
jgi:hypothetical protein